MTHTFLSPKNSKFHWLGIVGYLSHLVIGYDVVSVNKSAILHQINSGDLYPTPSGTSPVTKKHLSITFVKIKRCKFFHKEILHIFNPRGAVSFEAISRISYSQYNSHLGRDTLTFKNIVHLEWAPRYCFALITRSKIY